MKARQRVAILADDRDSFVRPTAEGVQRMLDACGATDHALLGKGTMLPGTSSRAGIKAAASVDASTR